MILSHLVEQLFIWYFKDVGLRVGFALYTCVPPNTADLGTDEKAAVFGNRRSYITKKTPNYTAVGCVTILTKLKRIYKETDVHFTGVELVSLHRLSLTVKKPLTVSRDVDVINAGQYTVCHFVHYAMRPKCIHKFYCGKWIKRFNKKQGPRLILNKRKGLNLAKRPAGNLAKHG